MAPKPATDGFLVSMRRIASAGVSLALAMVALLAVSGCGGSSSDDTKTASAPPSSTSTEESTTTPSSAAQGSKPKQSAGSQGSPEGKQGPKIKQPKGAKESAPSSEQREHAVLADMSISSPAIKIVGGEVQKLPSTYTCDGKNSWPQLDWTGIPPDSAELALFVMNAQPVKGKLFVDWAVSGIDPQTEGVKAGALPTSAIVGKNSFGHTGYEVCPPHKSSEDFIFAVYALPKPIAASKGFDSVAMREKVVAQASNVGLTAGRYERG